jgi:hypothetical protein|tara:strand:- start:2470 stop:2685 length:216 start_codon:yes stop_codon:yes gene_type:complete
MDGDGGALSNRLRGGRANVRVAAYSYDLSFCATFASPLKPWGREPWRDTAGDVAADPPAVDPAFDREACRR